MLKLKSFSLFIGDGQMIRLNNFSHKDNIPTPLYMDETNQKVISHQTETMKQIIDLSKVMMYTYELEEPQVTQ